MEPKKEPEPKINNFGSATLVLTVPVTVFYPKIQAMKRTDPKVRLWLLPNIRLQLLNTGE